MYVFDNIGRDNMFSRNLNPLALKNLELKLLEEFPNNLFTYYMEES